MVARGDRIGLESHGSIHQAPNLSVTKYAGDELWSYEEDAHKDMNWVVG